MRIVAQVAREHAGERLGQAALGLAGRGHQVVWNGPEPPLAADTLEIVPHLRDLARVRADVVVGDGRTPFRVALAGWFARADCMVLGIRRDLPTRWSWLDRWAWQALGSYGLIEPAEAEAFGRDPLGLEAGRLALWSDEPAPAVADAAHPDVEILERACERALARRRGRSARPAVFVDRDGTLVREVGYLSDPGDLELLPGVAGALQNLRAAGFPVVLISNQSGVGRGLFPLARVHHAMARLRELLREHGVELDAIYFCPHRPDEGCRCRKPGTGLLERAAEDLQLSLRDSVMIGDKLLDAATGRAAGGWGVLVRTGYGRDEEQRWKSGGEAAVPGSRAPDAVLDDLAQAAEWFLARATGAA